MNKLYKITEEKFEERKILNKYNDVKYIVVDAKGIRSYEEYFDKLWEAFGFDELPEGWNKDYHSEYDFLTDAENLPYNKYVFIIKNYNEMLKNNQSEKENIEDTYENYLLPFWDEEVERVVVGGKRKEFNIYLVLN